MISIGIYRFKFILVGLIILFTLINSFPTLIICFGQNGHIQLEIAAKTVQRSHHGPYQWQSDNKDCASQFYCHWYVEEKNCFDVILATSSCISNSFTSQVERNDHADDIFSPENIFTEKKLYAYLDIKTIPLIPNRYFTDLSSIILRV